MAMLEPLTRALHMGKYGYRTLERKTPANVK